MTDIDIDANQSAVDDFNAEHGSVTWVRYWTGTRDDAPKYNLTDGKAWLLGGHTPVVRVRGESSCIALTHVDVIPGQPDDIEDDSHDLPELAYAAERVCNYIAANGDGIYDVLDGHPLYARDLEALRRAADHVWAGEQLRDELEQTRAALKASQTNATTYANEVGNLTAENARVRQQRDAHADVVEAAKAWRESYGNTSVRFGDACTGLVAAVDALPKADQPNCECSYVHGSTTHCGRPATTETTVMPYGYLNVAETCRARIDGQAVTR